MSFLQTVKGWFSILISSRAKEEFNIEPIQSGEMDAWVNECVSIYQGNPSWINTEDHIDSINFAKALCEETARLTTLGIGIHVDGSARAKWLQQQIDNKVYYQLREWIEYGCAYGTVILKPNDDTVQLYKYGEFEVTHFTNGTIDGVVFHNVKKVNDNYYTRLEYHRFIDKYYVITNKCYVGKSENDAKRKIDIKLTPWADLKEEVFIENIEKPLFGVFRTPNANNIHLGSPYGLPIFSEAVQELRDLDIAYSRNAKEIVDSKRTVLIDSDRLFVSGKKLKNATAHASVMPDYVKTVEGTGGLDSDVYHEINPQLNTETRLKGINALLGQIGYKSGYSNGHYLYNESRGIMTATQVEADQQRTIQSIKDIRDKVENCINCLIYALNVFADLYNYAPAGNWETVFDFGDITYNHEEDRIRWWGFVQAGKVPAWKYFVKFEGMTEEEAKEMVAEATPKTPKLFGGEE